MTHATLWFKEYGCLGLLFLAGFSPIPYKVIYFVLGFFHMALKFLSYRPQPLVAAMRFFLVLQR